MILFCFIFYISAQLLASGSAMKTAVLTKPPGTDDTPYWLMPLLQQAGVRGCVFRFQWAGSGRSARQT